MKSTSLVEDSYKVNEYLKLDVVKIPNLIPSTYAHKCRAQVHMASKQWIPCNSH